MTLDLAADSETFVVDFGQTVKYRATPNATAREDLRAVVNLEPVDDTGGDDKAMPFAGKRAPVLHVLMRNSLTAGVTPSEIEQNLRSAEIEVAYPLGDTARWRRIQRILRHNAGIVLLEVSQ